MVLKVFKEQKDLKVLKAQQVLKVTKVIKDTMEHKEI